VGRLVTARRIKTAGRPRQPLLRQNRRFSSPHPFGWAGLARFEPRRLVSTSERGSRRESVLSQEPWHRRAADQHERDGPGSGNLIVITGTDRTDGTVSRPGQALVQDPAPILVTGQLLVTSFRLLTGPPAIAATLSCGVPAIEGATARQAASAVVRERPSGDRETASAFCGVSHAGNIDLPVRPVSVATVVDLRFGTRTCLAGVGRGLN
jgi:hypothetical protein